MYNTSYNFSDSSTKKLETCHDELQLLMREVIKKMNITILEGERPKKLQNLYYEQGKSQLKWPDSNHNIITPKQAARLGIESQPMSNAVDIAPWPVRWEDRFKERFYVMAGVVLTIADVLEINIRWGGDWDRDAWFHDQSFMDLPHFERLTGN